MKSILKFVADWVWVMQAYVRGIVLQQEAYLPRSNGELEIFMFDQDVSIERISCLIWLWGIKPITDTELMKLLTDHDFIKNFKFGDYVIWDTSRQNLKTCSFTKLSW